MNSKPERSYGKVLIFSAPSGAGKSTVVSHLLNKFSNLEFSISATSRAPRGAEQDGKEYYFITTEEFKEKIAGGEFVEYEEVYSGFFYGTLKSEIDRIWSSGKVAVFDIDVMGGINLKRIFGENALSIFINPPSIESLRERLTKRGTETPESIERRVAKAITEIEYSGRFDKIIVNDNLNQCLYQAERAVEQFIEGQS